MSYKRLEDAYRIYGPDFPTGKWAKDYMNAMLSIPNPSIYISRRDFKLLADNNATNSRFISEILGIDNFCLMDMIIYLKEKETKENC